MRTPANGSAAPITQGPSTGSEAPATGAPNLDLSLPEPTLGSIDEIVAAIDDPAQSGNVVVSILAQLGIGLYRADGTPIRAGTEASDADFFVFEPVAEGLVAMLRERDDPEAQLPFAEFHAALAAEGYAGSIDELAAGFADAYAGQPAAPISRLIHALGPIDASGTLSSFELLLLLLDGFIPPNGAATAMADARGGPPAVAVGGAGWGVAQSNFQHGGVPSDWVEMCWLLTGVLHAWRVTLTASPVTVHEGHGGVGSPAAISVQLAGPLTALISPFSGAAIVPAPPDPALPAWFDLDSRAAAHGSATSVHDANSTAAITYVPKQEAANGQGIDREEQGAIVAGVERRELAFALYGSFIVPYAWTLRASIQNTVVLNIGWHEEAEAVIKIVWTDTYDGVADTITFLGNLTATEGGPDTGGVLYTGTGIATGSRAGWAGCNPGIDTVPSGTVDATFNGILTGTGTIMISAYADAFSVLSGISTAPMEVPIVGGFAQFDSPLVGDLCPRSSHGEMTVTQLVLP